jgi:hypothetical protein
MANAAGPGALLEMAELAAAARALDIEAVTFEIRQAQDIALAFDSFKGRTEVALYQHGFACFHQPHSHQHPGAEHATANHV